MKGAAFNSDKRSPPLWVLLLHFHLNDVGFVVANANADADDACSDANATA